MSRDVERLLGRLTAEGVSPWLAARDPADLHTHLARRALGGTLFQGAVVPPSSPPHLVRRACEALESVFWSSRGATGLVSAPVDLRHARAGGEPLAAARSLHRSVQRPNLLVRLPMNTVGLGALPAILAEGIGVDASLVCSPERYGQVLDAFVSGMEALLASGLNGCVRTVTSVPVGLIDAEVDACLDRLGVAPGHPARGTAGLAVARVLYRSRERRLSGDRWRALRSRNTLPPRLVWTAGDHRSVAALVSWNTAQALSGQTVAAAARSPLRGDTLLNRAEDGHRALAALEDLGVRVDRLARSIEARELGCPGWEHARPVGLARLAPAGPGEAEGRQRRAPATTSGVDAGRQP